tara:strand:+ start:1876 stop:2103 length:228 start_codon:yes stop_codon:yes gene_type:complete
MKDFIYNDNRDNIIYIKAVVDIIAVDAVFAKGHGVISTGDFDCISLFLISESDFGLIKPISNIINTEKTKLIKYP